MAEISEDTLREILDAFAADERLPSARTIRELAVAVGKSEQAVKIEYTKLYQEMTDTKDDPWGPPEM